MELEPFKDPQFVIEAFEEVAAEPLEDLSQTATPECQSDDTTNVSTGQQASNDYKAVEEEYDDHKLAGDLSMLRNSLDLPSSLQGL